MINSQNLFFPRVEVSRTRGHSFKVREYKFKGDMWVRIFIESVMGAYNTLLASGSRYDTSV